MYGIIGKKLGHSFSAKFFNEKFKREGLPETYNLFPIPDIKEFPALIKDNQDLKGLNVTIPYKSEVIPYLQELSPEAKAIGAVNVIKIKRNGDSIHLEGHNTDSIGFRDSLSPLLNPNIKKALILGTGGASKAVAYILKQFGIDYTFVSRTPKENQLSYDDLTKEILEDNLLIVNTTPLGTFPDIDESPSLPYQYITPDHLCYDLVYNPEETQFLKKSASQGAKIKNGIEMLHGQALAAWDIWKSD